LLTYHERIRRHYVAYHGMPYTYWYITFCIIVLYVWLRLKSETHLANSHRHVFALVSSSSINYVSKTLKHGTKHHKKYHVIQVTLRREALSFFSY